ncbi:UNVERIFIED_CONTAM: Retinaldehyde-binding protein 1 [Trichonephila clavipes]
MPPRHKNFTACFAKIWVSLLVSDYVRNSDFAKAIVRNVDLEIGVWDPEKVDRDLLMWVITHCMIHSIEDEATQVAGYSAIIDVRGVSNKHLKLLTIENILLIIHSTQNCFPGRYKAVHVIGMPKFFAYAWNMCYPFILSYKMQKRVSECFITIID